jgi:hypothetical protein
MLRAQRQVSKKSTFATFTAISTALLMLVLAACGSTSTNVGGQPSPTPPQVQNCGSIHSLGPQIIPADQSMAQQAENCFWQAFQQCQPATFTYSQNGVDTGTVHKFSLKNINGTCSISDEVQHFIAPNPPGAAITYLCNDVKLQSDGLYFFSCGNIGTIFIPIK